MEQNHSVSLGISQFCKKPLYGRLEERGRMKDTTATATTESLKDIGSGSRYKEADDKVVVCEEQMRTRKSKLPNS